MLEIQKAENAIKKNNDDIFRESLENVMKSVSKLSPDLQKNVQDVLRKASINKASKIYEHGISMGQTAKLLGITLYELADYAGQRQDRNVPLFNTFSVQERIKLAMEMFK